MKACGATNKGAVRSVNQDRFLMKKIKKANSTLLVLCDGMGGTAAGEVAASIACQSFAEHVIKCTEDDAFLSSDVVLKESAIFANICVYDKAASDSNLTGMGTTLVAVLIADKNVSVVNIGDSRCYLYTDNKLVQITQDHSLVTELVKASIISPQEAKEHPQKNVITRAVGIDYSVKPDIYNFTINEDDIIMLCSDGLSNCMENEELRFILNLDCELSKKCHDLIAMALEKKASDNVTAVLFQY